MKNILINIKKRLGLFLVFSFAFSFFLNQVFWTFFINNEQNYTLLDIKWTFFYTFLFVFKIDFTLLFVKF